jgi:hypothetical protein
MCAKIVPKPLLPGWRTIKTKQTHLKNEKKVIKSNFYTSVNQTNLPRKLSARDRDFSGPLKVERVFRSSVTPSQESSQLSKFKSVKEEHRSKSSTKWGIKLLQV